MKLSRVMLASAVGVGASGFAGFGQQEPPQPAPAVVQTPDADVAALAQSIRQAADPSGAVAAYAAAMGRGGGVGANATVEDAYVRRMADFNLPDMAEAQAQDLLKQDPNNDVARAVVAYMQGRRGQAVDALATIAQATGGDRPVTDPFVLRTAGQLVAWYDTRADKTQVPDLLKTDIEAMRRKLSAQDTYGQAYASARDAYEGKPAPAIAADQQPQALQPQPSASSYDTSGQTVTVPVETPLPAAYDTSFAYPYPYGYSGYFQPSYYWPQYYHRPGYYMYGPAYVPPVIIPRHHGEWDHTHNGHDGHDGDHGHDGNHGASPGGSGTSPGTPGGLSPHMHRYDDVRTSRNRDGTVVVERAVEPTESKGHQDVPRKQPPRQDPPKQESSKQAPPPPQPRQPHSSSDGGSSVSRQADPPARTERKPDPPAPQQQQRSNDRTAQQQQQQPQSGDRKAR